MAWGKYGQYLIQRNIVNGCPIDFQDPISNMNGIFHIWTDAVCIHPEWKWKNDIKKPSNTFL